jgi:pimeloyl-ACP methyl ester carboxylesterase
MRLIGSIALVENFTLRETRRPGAPRICVTTLGEGPMVLMVHGFPESWYSWRHLMPVIAKAGYRAAALHVRGYDESGKPAAIEDYTLPRLACDIGAVIDAFGGDEPAVLVGHDWGSPQVAATALIHPEKVRALVSLSVPIAPYSARKPSEVWPELFGDQLFYHAYFQEPGRAEAELEGDVRGFLRKFLYGWCGARPAGVNAFARPAGSTTLTAGLPDPDPLPAWLSEEELDHYVESFTRGGFTGALNRYRAQDMDVELMRPYAARSIDQPSLFIAGERDPVRELSPGTDRYADPMARCTDCRGVHLLPGIGHWIQQEAPEEVAALLLPFLHSVAPVPSAAGR